MFHQSSSFGVAEIQGPYGPLHLLEHSIQQIWALQELCPGNWVTRSGKRLRLHYAGSWNRGPGPDFKEALFELDGQQTIGDVEIHLYREDWWRHGHDRDREYNAVKLHLVLFAGGMDRAIRCQDGNVPEEWVMGPWMREDIESVSGGLPGLFGELVPEIREWLESDSPTAIRQRLAGGADRRWLQKEALARCLMDNFGWAGALHRMFLYYLGHPANRISFYKMAESFPPEAWRREEILGLLRHRWRDEVSWGVGRPANQAEVRLRQYHLLNRDVPDWFERLRQPPVDTEIAISGEDTRSIRKAARLGEWRHWLRRDVMGACMNGALCDRLWIDVLLPMLSATRSPAPTFPVLWFHSWPGSFPDAYRDLLKLCEVQLRPSLPLCNGWIQGLLWAEEQMRLERVRTALTPSEV